MLRTAGGIGDVTARASAAMDLFIDQPHRKFSETDFGWFADSILAKIPKTINTSQDLPTA